MSPYGSIVGTVATTTTSPVAAWSARIMRSIARALVGVDDVREIVDRRGQLGQGIRGASWRRRESERTQRDNEQMRRRPDGCDR